MTQRRAITFRYALDSLVLWGAHDTQPYRIDQRRWVESHTGTWAEYALVSSPHPAGIMCWVNEADLVVEERVR
jgi:hypothetical protein